MLLILGFGNFEICDWVCTLQSAVLLLFNKKYCFDLQADNSSHRSKHYLLCSDALSGAWCNGGHHSYGSNGISMCLSQLSDGL